MIEIKKYKATDAIFIYFAALLAGSIFSIFIKSEKNPNFTIFAGYFITQASFFAAILLYSKIKKIDIFYNIPIRRKVCASEIISAIILSFCIFAFTLLPILLFSWLMVCVGITADVALPDLQSLGSKLLALAILCALPAIAEELLVRGVFLTAYEKFGGVASLLLSAAVFALMHLHIMQLLHQFVVGLILGYIVLRTQKLTLAIIIHFINNVIALFLPLIVPSVNDITFSTPTIAVLLAVMIVGLILGLAAIYVLLKASLSQDKSKGIKAYASLWKDAFIAITKGIRKIFTTKGAANFKGDFTATLPTKNTSITSSNEGIVSLAFLGFLALLAIFATFW